ncbi:uncharacterized protein [Dermacentor andersoni]|uniref:uncharacterized protein n=1 Tax=Dermacentor andersoni TaxID=34620 RepID=UPI003B3A27E4
MRTGILGALVVISFVSTTAVTADNTTILVRSKRQGILGSLFKPILDAGKPRQQEEQQQGADYPHGAPIQDKNVVNKFLENLQRSQHNFNVPRRRSSFFGPAINALRQFQICTTPLTTPGKCRYVRECVLPAFLENFDVFLRYSCVIGNRHLGVCCPDEFFGNILSPRKPLFPIISGLLNIGKNPSRPPPVQNPDYDDGPGDPNIHQPLTPDEQVDGHGGVPPNNQPVQPQPPVNPQPQPQPQPQPSPAPQPKPVQPKPVQPKPVQPKPVQPPPVQPPPAQPTPSRPLPNNSPTANAPIQFPDDDEEEAEGHDAQAQKPPSRPQPDGGQTSERQKPLPPVPPGLAQLTKSCGLNFKTRIVGGTIAKPDDWTWMAALLRKADDDQFCGGALISDRYVITAAHCTQGLRPQNITVRLGEYDFKQNTTSRLPRDFNVSRIRQHPEFRKDTYQNDIALLRMSRRVRFSENIRPICLPKSPDESFLGKLATVVGWGTLSFGGPSSSILRQVSLPVWDNTECKTKFTQAIPKIFLCAGTREGGQDACQGDSGGPLMVEGESTQWTLIGVVSWGIKCAEKGLPGVYTRITEFLGWIYENAV